ncbi:hypothetical protein, partial [Photobacterium carnosum]|uniref:hypothetical protein n=1 Tax=Photobacterium carnosum TaxID=2023717 RepID=UPI001E3DE55A
MGFFDNLINGQLKELHRVFYAEPHTVVTHSDDDFIYAHIEYHKTSTYKNNQSNIEIEQSYFDSDEIYTDNISGVIIMKAREISSNQGDLYKNHNAKIKISNDLDFISHILHDIPKNDYFIQTI